MRNTTRTLLIGLLLLVAAAAAAYAMQGRAYVQRQRQIEKMTKDMVTHEDEVKSFAKLLDELDHCDMSESTRDYWHTAQSVKAAMEEQLHEAREELKKEAPVQQAQVGDSASMSAATDSTATSLATCVHRMEMIYRESEGLRNSFSLNDPSVIKRYRLLAGRFHDTLEQGIAARQAKIDALKALNRSQR